MQIACFSLGVIFRLVRQIWGVKLGTNTLLLLVFGRFVKKFIELRVDDLTTKDQWLLYLEVTKLYEA